MPRNTKPAPASPPDTQGNNPPAAPAPADKPQSAAKTRPAKAPAKPRAKPKTTKAAVLPDKKDEQVALPPLVVGVGASAGGLEAFTELLRHLPRDTGMAFVLLQHLPAKQHSMLAQILSKATLLPVEEAQEGVTPQPDHVYILPPGEVMEIRKGALRLVRREVSEGRYLPVDTFLNSLAEERGGQAIGVILSGTASDGVQGMKAIKEAGGITFAQDVQTAKYPGMPQSSIAAGCVDFVLPPAGIARELNRIARHPYITPAVPEEVMKPEEESAFGQILALLKRSTGVDFTYYKHSTIRRRTFRRMALNKVENLKNYLDYLREHSEEVSELYADILINVTSFFRDPEVFEELKDEVYPLLMKDRTMEAPVRIWVPGCSTGEEVYSLAISLLEYFAENNLEVPLQIFGTDIDTAAIEVARAGRYGAQVIESVSPQRLARYFIKVDGGYQIHKSIRDRCTFARQNIVKDPPFSHLDLISCRNVLIYLGPVLQRKVIPIFHFALKPQGFLLLGRSEAIGAFQEMFTLVDKKNKVYIKKDLPARLPLQFSLNEYLDRVETPLPPAVPETPASSLDLMKEADRIVLARFSPAGVVVDEEMKILQFRGHTGPYLEPMPGEASLNLLRMVREGLRPEVGAAMHHAIKGGSPVRKEGLKVKYNGQIRDVNIEVFPISPPTFKERFFLVVFEDVTRLAAPAPEAAAARPRKGKATSREERLKELEQELSATKDYLQATIEEQEATLEELKSTNEEIMSSNEELQSLNEELEASKEELQSANEELATVNEELENRNAELSQVNDDLINLLSSVNLPIVFLDQNLRIRRFNSTAKEVLRLIPGDTGRPLGDIKMGLEIENLESVMREALDNLKIQSREVQDREGRWHLLQVRPYRTAENKIEGLVLTMADIHDLKLNLIKVQQGKDYAQAIVDTIRDPLLVLDANLRVVSANQAFYSFFQAAPDDTETRSLLKLGQGQWDLPELRDRLQQVLSKDQQLENYELEIELSHLGRRSLLLNAWAMPLDSEGQKRILLTILDITARKDGEAALKTSERELRQLACQLLNVQERERQKISWELHEELGQSLATLKMNLSEVEKGLTQDKAKEKCRESLKIIEEAIEGIRRLAKDLSPAALQDLGLAGCLRQMAAAIGRDYQLDCQVEADEDVNRLFPLEDQISIYRVFQEAFNNIGKHARASKVALAARLKDGQAFFQIADNGRGFDLRQVLGAEAGCNAVGLRAMMERIRLLGGALKIDSREGVGTTLSFALPGQEGGS